MKKWCASPFPFFLLLLLAGGARADSFLDREAPVPAVTQWVTGEPPPAWKELKGSCALLELLDPDELVCQGLVSLTVKVVGATKERKLLVFSVAVGTGADDEKARTFAKRFNVTWPLGVDRKGETYFGCGAPTLPRWYLVAPDGKVMWEGSPGALSAETLGGFLDRARLWRPAEIAKTVRPAADAYVKGMFSAAAKKAAAALAAARKRAKAGLRVEGDVEKDATLVADGLKAVATLRLSIADGMAKERLSLDAEDLLQSVATGFAGTEWEGKAKEALAVMAADARAQAEILAGKKLREILASVKPNVRRTVEKAIAELDVLLATYGNLRSGERAQAAKAKLEALLSAK